LNSAVEDVDFKAVRKQQQPLAADMAAIPTGAKS
jgi:hypothetical protein